MTDIKEKKKRGLSQKQELACLVYFETANMAKALKAAGYSEKTMPTLVFQRPAMQQRLTELREAVASASVADVLERKQRLTEFLRANITDFVDENGNIKLDVANRGAIAELTIEDWQSAYAGTAQSRTKRIKLHSPIQAIAELNKMEHIYETGAIINQDNRQINIIVRNKETADMIDQIAERTKKLAVGQENSGDTGD